MNAAGSMVVKNVSDEIQEIFDVTGFSDILNIE
jgi:anti-sigma B factor antagonist